MELNEGTEIVDPDELLRRIAGHMESVVGDMAAVRESQAKCEFNVKNMHAQIVLFMGDKCPPELQDLDVEPVINVEKETRTETLVDKKRSQRRRAREAAPCDMEYDPEVEPGQLQIDVDTHDGDGEEEAGAGDDNFARGGSAPTTKAAAVPAKKAPPAKKQPPTKGALKAVLPQTAAKPPPQKFAAANKKLADMSLRDSSALANRLKVLQKTPATPVTPASTAKKSAVAEETVVDFSNIIGHDNAGRHVYGMMAGDGACVVYEIDDTFDFGPILNKATAEALTTEKLKLPSEIQGLAQQRVISLNIITNLVMSELSSYKHSPLFLEGDVVYDPTGLSMRELVEKQPEPVRSAMWTTFKVLQLQDDSATVGMMASIVTQLEHYLHSLRLGNAPADISRKPATTAAAE